MFERDPYLENYQPYIFGQECNAKATEDPAYMRLAKNEWDTFRDLSRVFERCDFNYDNTLMIDSDSYKV